MNTTTRRAAAFASAFAVAALALLPLPAAAVNKCTGPDGKVAFQDAPCSGKGETLTVRPASGAAPAATRTAAGASDTPAAPTTEAQRINAQIAASQKARRVQELELRSVPGAQADVDRLRQQCDGEMQALRRQKSNANNNLAGATWEGAISGEMTAVATRCDTRTRELRDDAQRLLAECRQLGGCK